ncbi:hypothetical protein FO519_004237 [Halicephalobus sp. NKZ332]|nr:hypothetical protein FO519_004237 [Halicephalobus sp. NKZ332]
MVTAEFSTEPLTRFKELQQLFLEKGKKSKLKEIRTLFNDLKDDASGLKEISDSLDFVFITKILTMYTATQTETDLVIFDILNFIDRIAKIDLKPIMPLVFGPTTTEHYSNLLKLGRAVHVCPKPNEVLTCLDPTFLWNTGVKINEFVPGQLEQKNVLLYDPRFVGLLILETVQAGTEVDLKKFIERNVLSFAIFLTSSHDENLRAIGYSILGDFLLKLKDLSERSFEEQPLIIYALFRIKNNLTKNQRISHIPANFFARCVKVLLTPDHPVFPRIISFFYSKYSFKMDVIPEFINMVMSSSTIHGLQERYWMMEIVAESLLNEEDYKILEKINGTSLILSMFSSQFVTKLSIKWTFMILRALMSIPMAVRNLCLKLNFHSWVAAVVQFKKLTRWQLGFLTQIFVTYTFKVRNMLFEGAGDVSEGLSGRYLRTELMIKAALKKIALIMIMEEDDVRHNRSSEREYCKWDEIEKIKES